MNRKHIENIIRHEFKKTPYTLLDITWNEWKDGWGYDNTEAVIILKEVFSWKKLYRRFSRLEDKLNKKYGYGIMLDCINEEG